LSKTTEKPGKYFLNSLVNTVVALLPQHQPFGHGSIKTVFRLANCITGRIPVGKKRHIKQFLYYLNIIATKFSN